MSENLTPCDKCGGTGKVSTRFIVNWWDDCPKCLGEQTLIDGQPRRSVDMGPFLVAVVIAFAAFAFGVQTFVALY